MSAAKFRAKRAKELRALNQILQESLTCRNAEILNGAADHCLNYMPNGADSWGYSIHGLTFQVGKPQKTLPENGGKFLDVTVDLIVTGKCIENDEPDCFSGLTLDIKVSNTGTNGVENLCTWHFDRHIDGGNEGNEIHPLYHFQHGGKGMNEIAESLGRVLLLSAPRIPFPPMDALLAVDFILSNFAGEDWHKLRDDGAYKNNIYESQLRLWKPYIHSIWSFWQPGAHDRNKIISLWPNLINLHN